MGKYVSSAASIKPMTFEDFKTNYAEAFPRKQLANPKCLKLLRIDLRYYSLDFCEGLVEMKEKIGEMFTEIERQCEEQKIPLDKIRVYTEPDFETGEGNSYCDYSEYSKAVWESDEEYNARLLPEYEKYLADFARNLL